MAEKSENPAILIAPGDLPREFDQAGEALRGRDVPFFVRGGQLCRVRRMAEARTDGGVVRPKGAIELVALDFSAMRMALEESTAFERFDARAEKCVRANPPAALIDALLAMPDRGGWRQAVAVCDHPLVDIATGKPIEPPYFGGDGEALHFDFYDARNALIFDFGGSSWPRVPHAPDRKDAEESAARLLSLIRYFAFETEIDRSVAVSAIVTAVMGPVLETKPAHAIDASAPGSGKSLLADAIGVIASGAPPATIEWPRDPDEAAKRLDALLLTGAPLINLDNVEAPLGGAALCQTLTQARRDVRILGKTATVRVPTRSMLLATGNNLTVRGDAVRRFVVARLDAKTERPELRVFEQDLRSDVRVNRVGLVLAALTIVAAYARAGRPSVGTTPLGSFETWSCVVRNALIWSGLPDPVRAQDRLRAADPDRESALAVFAAWRAAFVDRALTVSEVVAAAGTYPELREALELVAGRAGSIDARRLGYWLRAHRDSRIAGMVLVGEDTPRSGKQWAVRLA